MDTDERGDGEKFGVVGGSWRVFQILCRKKSSGNPLVSKQILKYYLKRSLTTKSPHMHGPWHSEKTGYKMKIIL